MQLLILLVAMTGSATSAWAACPELERVRLNTGSDDGIGGSGRNGGGDDDGIGGSGLYGTVTGFGSICLNGRRIRYADDVPVSVAGIAGSTDDLAVGQVVQVLARNDVAEGIEVKYAVVGRMDVADQSGVRIADVEVRLAEGASIDTRMLEPGSRVAVSGLWHPDGSVVASRVEAARGEWSNGTTPPVAADAFASEVKDLDVEGYVVRADADAIEVGSVRFEPEDPANLPAVGARVRIRALRYDSGRLRVRELDRIRSPRLQMERPDRNEIGAARTAELPDANDPIEARGDAGARHRDRHRDPRRPPIERDGVERLSRPDPPERPPIERPRAPDFRNRPRMPRPGPGPRH